MWSRVISLLLVAATIATWVASAFQHDVPERIEQMVRGGRQAPAMAVGPAAMEAASDTDLPDGAVVRLGTVRFRDGEHIRAIHLSPDGKFLATTSQQGTVRLWDAANGKPLRALSENRGWGSDCAFTPDSANLLVMTGGNVQTYETASGKRLRQFADPYGSQVFALSRDGKRAATGGYEGIVRVYDAVSGKSVKQMEAFRENVRALTFSPDGKILASGHGSSILVWETESGKQLFKLRRHPGGVTALTFAPDGKTMASAGLDNTIRLWDMSTGKLIRDFGHHATDGDDNENWRWGFNRGEKVDLAFTPDGKELVSSSSADRIIRVWEPETGKELRKLSGHGGGVNGISLSGDGKVLASASQDNTLRLWDLATGKELSPQDGHQGAALGVAFVNDGKQVITAGRDNTVRVWDRTTGKETHRFGDADELARVAFAADGQTVALARQDDDAIYLSEPSTGKELRQLRGGQNRVNAVTFAPDGKRVLSATTDNVFTLWDATTGKKVRSFGNSSGFGFNNMYITPMSFTADGKQVATRGYAQNKSNITFWDVNTGKEGRTIEWPDRSYPLHVATSPDGKQVAGIDYEGNINLWSVTTGKALRRFQHQQRNFERYSHMPVLCFSPDGRVLASVFWDQTVWLWETATGKQIRELKGHRGTVTSVAFAPDGRCLATSSTDTTGLVWDMILPTTEEKNEAAKLPQQGIEALWTDMANAEATKGHRAVRILLVDPKRALTLYQEKLKPVDAVDPQKLAQLMTDLDSNVFVTRKKANEELEKLGDLAEGVLRDALNGKPSAEVRQRVEAILAKLDGPNISDERLRSLRAIAVLEQMNTADSRQLLGKLAGGVPVALTTKEAKASLERIEHRLGSRPQ